MYVYVEYDADVLQIASQSVSQSLLCVTMSCHLLGGKEMELAAMSCYSYRAW